MLLQGRTELSSVEKKLPIESIFKFVKNEHVLMIWKWALRIFVSYKKSDLGNYLLLIFWCRGRVLCESKFCCIVAFLFLVKCDSQGSFVLISQQPCAKHSSPCSDSSVRLGFKYCSQYTKRAPMLVSVWYIRQVHDIYTSHIFECLLYWSSIFFFRSYLRQKLHVWHAFSFF